jgi:hypothetical protein
VFYSNLAEVCDKHKFRCQAIYNTEEINVQKPIRIDAKKSMKQVGAVTTADRGSLVTIAVAVKRE